MESTSDKIWHHGYQRYYDNFFRNIVVCPNVLEIGIDNGYSLGLWSTYLVDPKMHAIDIKNKSVPDWVSFCCVDQSSASMLESYASDKLDYFDVIIDDGSHVPEHQMLTLEKLWKCLKPGGAYVIEDTETCYWRRTELYGYEFDGRVRSVNIIRQLPDIVDFVNSEFSDVSKHPDGRLSVYKDIDMVMVGANCICLIKKNPTEYSQYYEREYRNAGLMNRRSPLLRGMRFVLHHVRLFKSIFLNRFSR